MKVYETGGDVAGAKKLSPIGLELASVARRAFLQSPPLLRLARFDVLGNSL
jgi:hypothetical protein